MNDTNISKLKLSLRDKISFVSSPLINLEGSIKLILEKRYFELLRKHTRIIESAVKVLIKGT